MRYRIRVKNNANEEEQLSKNNSNDELFVENLTSRPLLLNNNIDNWQLEIRKATYDDIGVYQCSLPLVNPQYKNITVKIIRM